jgi:hypothetical protein
MKNNRVCLSLIPVLILSFEVSFGQMTTANETKSQKVEKTELAGSSDKTEKTEKTEHNFEDLLVQGKYHFSDEAVTTVEEDKVLDSLLGVRTDFKDKIEQSVGRY